MSKLGKSKHKRNPAPACEASAKMGRAFMRKHWQKEVWDAVEEAWKNRTGFHWGKTRVSKQFTVSVKTIEHMLELIKNNVSWLEATGRAF